MGEVDYLYARRDEQTVLVPGYLSYEKCDYPAKITRAGSDALPAPFLSFGILVLWPPV